MGRVTIESDGTPRNTIIRDAETGEQIKGVRWLKVVIDAETRKAYAVLEMVVQLDKLKIDSVRVQEPEPADESAAEAAPAPAAP